MRSASTDSEFHANCFPAPEGIIFGMTAGLNERSDQSQSIHQRGHKRFVFVSFALVAIVLLTGLWLAKHFTRSSPLLVTIVGNTNFSGQWLTALHLRNQTDQAYGYQVDSEFSVSNVWYAGLGRGMSVGLDSPYSGVLRAHSNVVVGVPVRQGKNRFIILYERAPNVLESSASALYQRFGSTVYTRWGWGDPFLPRRESLILTQDN